MPVSSCWMHGNALTIESPFFFHPEGRLLGQIRLTPFGWGADISTEGTSIGRSWMHMPIPTVNGSVSGSENFELLRVFLLFECSDSALIEFHVYDGYHKIQEFPRSGSLTGDFRVKGHRNTFELAKPYRVKSGVSLSFLFAPHVLTDTGGGGKAVNPHLVVTAAGAEFSTSSRFVTFFATLLPRFSSTVRRLLP